MVNRRGRFDCRRSTWRNGGPKVDDLPRGHVIRGQIWDRRKRPKKPDAKASA